MRSLVISSAVLDKLKEKHGVSVREVEQCFENRIGIFLVDEKEDHRTDPPTLWFVAPTNCGRFLKVVFIFIDGNIHIKSAFDAKQSAIDMYDRVGK